MQHIEGKDLLLAVLQGFIYLFFWPSNCHM